jgi:putative hydrolase of the HAD superfamily
MLEAEGTMTELPSALLLDLDDTILDDSSGTERCWTEALAAVATRLGALEPERLQAAIDEYRTWYWDDPERHRAGRLDLEAARAHIIATALERLGAEPEPLATEIATAYKALREECMAPLPGALETLSLLREGGVKLALLTNGAGAAQRRKIDRHGLDPFFDCIVVEGEFGCGKPDPRCFRHALEQLGARAGDAWMAGDNLVWDVAGAQALGIFAIWVDFAGKGLPPGSPTRPDRIVRSIRELVG